MSSTSSSPFTTTIFAYVDFLRARVACFYSLPCGPVHFFHVPSCCIRPCRSSSPPLDNQNRLPKVRFSTLKGRTDTSRVRCTVRRSGRVALGLSPGFGLLGGVKKNLKFEHEHMSPHKNSQRIDQTYMLFTACVLKNLLLAVNKLYIAKKHRFYQSGLPRLSIVSSTDCGTVIQAAQFPRLFCAFLGPLFLRTFTATCRHCSWLPSSVFACFDDQDGFFCDDMASFNSGIYFLLLFVVTRTTKAIFFPSCFLSPDDIGAVRVCTSFRRFEVQCAHRLRFQAKCQVFLQVPIPSPSFRISTLHCRKFFVVKHCANKKDDLGVCLLQKEKGEDLST